MYETLLPLWTMRHKVKLLPFLIPILAQAQPAQPVAKVGDTEISADQLSNAVEDRLLSLRTEEYSIRSAALAKLIDAAVLAGEAQKRGVSVEQLLESEVSSKIPALTPDEARAVYEATHSAAKMAPFEADLKAVTETTRLRRSAAAKEAFVDDLRQQRDIRIFLTPPRASRALEGTGPSQGKPDAPVTIVEFSDFQCPHCAGVEKTLTELRTAYGDKLRIVYRNLPLSMHSFARAAAEAALCADRQGRFWEMHDQLFAHQQALLPADLAKYATAIGLDEDAFERCTREHETVKTLADDLLAAAQLGITGTPAFLINGRLISGARSVADFRRVIDDELRTAAGSRTTPVP